MKRFMVIAAILFFAEFSFASEVKQADLAGSWYPSSGAELRSMLQGYLDAAKPEKIEGKILAIITPHAGYQFSGPIAAYGFKSVQGKGVSTVIIVGFSHRKYYNGIAIYNRGMWRTPIGDVQVDESLAKEIASKNPRFSFVPGIFNEENSVEMEVPFVQIALPGAKIVPIAFGTQDYKDISVLADALSSVLRDREDVLICASTDLSHYHVYQEAGAIDKHTISMISSMDPKALYEEGRMGISELCGLMPVAAAVLTAKSLGYTSLKVLKYANSGDTSGDKTRVVGYVSAAFFRTDGPDKVSIGADRSQSAVVQATKSGNAANEGEGRTMFNESQRNRLLQIARESITSYVKDGKRSSFKEDDEALNRNMGAFVTLQEGGELRGCIGNMVGSGPLYKTVSDMAVEAATGDPRFQSLSTEEINKIRIEISVLSPLKKVSSYKDVKIPGDGVIIRSGYRSGVYLPQVAEETGWNREQFLTSLCAHKAGLKPDAWKDPTTEIYVFSAEVFGEKGGK